MLKFNNGKISIEISDEIVSLIKILPLDLKGQINKRWRIKDTFKPLILFEKNFNSISELKFIIDNELTSYPKCETCQKTLNSFKTIFCSKKCAANNSFIQEKRENTCIQKYGCENISSNKEIRKKIKQTNLKRYGHENAAHSTYAKEKIKQTNITRYGTENPQQNILIKQKTQKTNLEKYGVNCTLNNKEIKNKIKIKARNKYWEKLNLSLKNKNIIPLFSKEEYINWNNSEELTYNCLDCNKEFKINKAHYQVVYCPYCFKESRSNAEKELASWLKGLGLNVIESSRDIIKPKELDIYLPDYKIAIEYNGLYWHSDKFANRNDLLNKTNLCNAHNIQLIHIFENEWLDKKDIVKSIILAKLGIFERRIFARKCIAKTINNNEYKTFCENNHVQNYAVAAKMIGLFYQDELISIASWAKSRFKKDEYELIRFCTKLNTQVIGGLSKLIKASSLNKFITYCDLRYSNGNGYENNGFELIGQSPPNYFYWKPNSLILESRQKYQKHKLPNLLKSFNINLSEQENMINNKYLILYDCGNLKFEFLSK